MDTIKQEDMNDIGRRGGVIRYTRCSGKSLTMVMLGRSCWTPLRLSVVWHQLQGSPP